MKLGKAKHNEVKYACSSVIMLPKQHSQVAQDVQSMKTLSHKMYVLHRPERLWVLLSLHS